MTLGDTNAVNHLISREDISNRDRLLKVLTSPLYFVFNSTTIELDFHDVSFLLSVPQELHLKAQIRLSAPKLR